jgi:hypothetical protein
MWLTKIWDDGNTVYETILTHKKPTQEEIDNYFNKYYPDGMGFTEDHLHTIDEIHAVETLSQAVSYQAIDQTTPIDCVNCKDIYTISQKDSLCHKCHNKEQWEKLRNFYSARLKK